jgi:DNA-binding response OmpR family regulator
MKILLVLHQDDYDDNEGRVHWDEDLGRGLRRALQQLGHAVLVATNDESLQQMLKRRPDLILVAPDLIELDGRRLFDQPSKGPTPILMPIPSIPRKGLVRPETGETDPSFEQANLRLANHIVRHLRRLTKKESSQVKVGALTIRFEEKRAIFHGQLLLLTPLQFALIGVLALNAGLVISPSELVESVWGYQGDDTEARELLKVHIRRLRQKMSAISPEGSQYIQSVRGFGYRLEVPSKG